jgi:predicted nucleotidyltransferase
MSENSEDALVHLDDTARVCVRRYLSLLVSQLGENLTEVWLFGSAARGDMWPTNMPMRSDVDMLVLTNEEVNADVQEHLINETYPLFLECGRQISPIFKATARFLTATERGREFRQRVQAEGLCLYAVGHSARLKPLA